MSRFFTKITRWISDLGGCEGEAMHANHGSNHAVAINAMRVIIVQDGDDAWFAQSLDIDYAAGGSSLENAQRNFETGLSATIKAHLERFGHIERIMRSPDLGDWVPLLSRQGKEFEYSTVESHELKDSVLSEHLPYTGISYIEGQRKAA
ncbi:MAG: hypothetical protein AB1648_09885 [Pseudomonadota bacterium]